ncbi:CidA/LrgA family protein [Stutzerimonas azotifigens]|uniref:CidA/LrgA family protein n=1 Tax=Stutzerimonas azotifigens TaxID=291995 RepID=UPI00040FDDE3|nr:CidA/LrgA family protein [Stutzerimonas azotifigens]
MLKGLTFLVLLQLCGSLISQTLLPMLPGPIIGLLLLLGWLLVRGEIGEPLTQAANGLLQYLPLLLVVPAAGILVSGEQLLGDLGAILAALLLSLLVTVPLCGWLMQAMIRRIDRARDER